MRCCAAQRWTTIARMRTLMTFVLNDGQQFVDAGLRVKRLKEGPKNYYPSNDRFYRIDHSDLMPDTLQARRFPALAPLS